MATYSVLVGYGSNVGATKVGDIAYFYGDVTVAGSVIVRGGVEVDSLETLMPIGTPALGGEALRFDTVTAAAGGFPIEQGGRIQFGGQCWSGAASVFGAGMRITPIIDTQVAGVPSTYHFEIGNRTGTEKWRIDQDGYVTMQGNLDSRAIVLLKPAALGEALEVSTATAASAGPGAIQNPGYILWAGNCWTGAVPVAAPFMSQWGYIDTQAAGVPQLYHLEIRDRLGQEFWRLNQSGTMRTMQMLFGAAHGATPAAEVAGYQLRNDTLADGGAGGNVQVSSSLVMHGAARNTLAGTSETHDWREYILPVTAAGATSSLTVWERSLNGAPYATAMSLSDAGVLAVSPTGCFVSAKTALKETAAWIVLSSPATVAPAQSDGMLLTNNASGAVARNEYSPSVRFDATGYTAAGAVYWRQSWAITAKPTDATHGYLAFDFTTPPAGLAYAEKMTLSKNGELRIGDGSAGIPALGPLSDPNTGFFFDGADALYAATNGIQRLAINTATATYGVDIVVANSATAITSGNYILNIAGGIAAGANTAINIGSVNGLTVGGKIAAFRNASFEYAYITYLGGYDAAQQALGTTPTDAFVAENVTPASGGTTVQMSGRMRWKGSAWNSNAGILAPEYHEFRAHVLPVTSATLTTASLDFGYQFNAAGGFNNIMSLGASVLNAVYGGTLTVTRSAIGATSTAYAQARCGLILDNPTASVSPGVTTQVSPAAEFLSHAWASGAGADDTHSWKIVGVSITGVTSFSNLSFQRAKKTGAGAWSTYSEYLRFDSENSTIYSPWPIYSGDKLVAGGTKVYFYGDVTLLGVANSPAVYGNVAGKALVLSTVAADGVSAVGVRMGPDNPYSTAGAKLLSVMNATVEKSYIDWDGAYVVPKTAVTALIAPSVTGPVSSDGLLLTNWNSGATGVQEFSPSVRLDGVGYTAAATYTRQSWAINNQPVDATHGMLAFSFASAGGAYGAAKATLSEIGTFAAVLFKTTTVATANGAGACTLLSDTAGAKTNAGWLPMVLSTGVTVLIPYMAPG